MKIIVISILAILLTGGAFAARYVPYPYKNVQDYFSDKYQGALRAQEERLPAPPASYVDQSNGQVYVYRPAGWGLSGYNYPVTQNSYYRISDQAVTVGIVAGSYDDGFNRGYYSGYEDGMTLRPFGYEAYFDYTEAQKAKQDTKREGYYQFPDAQVKITVTQSNDHYNQGYQAGIMQGFKDAFYDVEYKGLNRDYYANQALLEKYPGQYEPLPVPFRTKNSYNSFPAFGYYSGGRNLYGFNYR
jgi:hypothetical protein